MSSAKTAVRTSIYSNAVCCVNFLWPKTQFMWIFAWAVPWLFWVSNCSWTLSGVTCLGVVVSVPGSLGAFDFFIRKY